MIKIIVTGISGRMGSRIADLIRQSPKLRLVGATEAKDSFAIGTLLDGQHAVVDDLAKCIERCDVVIDFSSPASSLHHAEVARAHRKALVLGTTGFSPAEKETMGRLLSEIPAVWSPNMSIGVNVLLKLVSEAARHLESSYDIEVVEMHHRHKKDAPSGTALALAEAAAQARGLHLGEVGCKSRDGQIGERKTNEIGIQSLRGGDVVGDHRVIFAGPGERVELAHYAGSRDNFALGALRAAEWVAGQKPGIYTMQDVLQLK